MQCMCFEDALAFVRSRRTIVPNAGFRAHLRAFQGSGASVSGSRSSSSPVSLVSLVSGEEAQKGAMEFADRKYMELATQGSPLIDDETGLWPGYEPYLAAFKEALLSGHTDWQAIDRKFGL